LFENSITNEAYKDLEYGNPTDVTKIFSKFIIQNFSSIIDRAFHVVNQRLDLQVPNKSGFVREVESKLKSKNKTKILNCLKTMKDHHHQSRHDLVHNKSVDEFLHTTAHFLTSCVEIFESEGIQHGFDDVDVNLFIDKAAQEIKGLKYGQNLKALESKIYSLFDELEREI
jgi:hypothetical protein